LNSLLSQHPDIHTTSTSPVSLICENVRKTRTGEFYIYDVNDPNSPCWEITGAILYTTYKNVTKKIVIDKNRRWSVEAENLRKMTGEDPKILSPVRSIPEVIASFITLSQKIGINNEIDSLVRRLHRESNVWGQSRTIWENYIYRHWRELKVGFEADPECFLLIEYDDIVDNSEEVIKGIAEFLDVFPHDFSTSNLTNSNPEDDRKHKLPGLHDIGPDLKRISPPAIEVLGEACYEFWTDKNLEFWRNA
jgi:hypothetical protein